MKRWLLLLAVCVAVMQVVLIAVDRPVQTQAPEIRQLFGDMLARVDHSKDGSLSLEEYLPYGTPQEFEQMDLNRNGRVGLEELERAFFSLDPAPQRVRKPSTWSTRCFEDAGRFEERSGRQLVILVALDTLRADRLDCYGHDRPTCPSIDSLAAQGTVFENAFSQANWTLPSFSSLFTGRQLADASPKCRMPASAPTLASLLQAHGVRTAAFVGGGSLSHQNGFDRGFDRYDDNADFGSFFHTMPRALEFLGDCARGTTPAFLFIHGYDMHSPYHKPLFFENLFDPGYDGLASEIVRSPMGAGLVQDGRYNRRAAQERTQPRWSPTGRADDGSVLLAPADRRHVGAAYDGALAYADVFVGLLLFRLKQLGLQDRTLVVLLSDHGEQLLEDGRIGHRFDLQDSELKVPLILWGPGIPRGRRVKRVVQLVDVLPTVLDWMHIDKPLSLAGSSLVQGGSVGPDDGGGEAVAVSETAATIRTLRYRLIVPRASGAKARLVDLRSDPAGRHNLVDQAGLKAVKAELRRVLTRRLGGG